ncbi:putative death-receptor fusion protein-domain-containing protein [Mortierella sp. GBAus27b]|nr:hypothetical protein BGX31_005107 [Mortierella sp. GBA43]KAI8349511.1 putative death-receptor fusion protein-domain-containing protein [Mortierella sp. GBAus27b]
MVLHQRTRQAFQSKDLSAAYSRAWSDLAEPFRSLSQEEPLVQAWLDFIEASRHEQETYGKTTEQQQAAALKKLEQAVKTQRQKQSQLLDQEEFQKGFAQFLAYYHYASAKMATRKQIFGIIQALQTRFQPDETDQHGIIVSALRSVIMNDVFAINTQPRIEIEMAWHQRALCLYTTLDHALGRTAFNADLEVILDQLSQLLHARVLATNIKADHLPSEYTEAMQDLEFILKLILAIISRLLASSSQSLSTDRLQLSTTHGSQPSIIQILKDAIIVSSSPVYHRDVSSISGMIFANLVDLTSPAVQEVAHRVVGLVFGENGQDVSFLPTVPRDMIAMDFGWNTYQGENCNPGEDDAGMYMLGIVRGLLTNIRQEALVMPVENLACWYAPEVFQDLPMDNGLVLHQILFHAIAYLCATSKDMTTKTFAFETMGHWLQQTKLHLSESSTASKEMKETLVNCINERAQEKLTAYVLDYWEDPVDTVQHKVKNILELMLDIVYLKAGLQNEQGTPVYVTRLLERILMADGHRKSKYPILAILVGRVRIAEVVSLRQDALAQAIFALEQLATAPGAAVAINAMIEKSWKECLEQSIGGSNAPPTTTPKSAKKRGQVGASSTPSSGGTRAARRASLQSWTDFWLRPIAQGLTSETDLVRKHLGHLVIPRLFPLCAEAFWILLEVFNGGDNTNSGYISDENYRLNAIVLIIKIARSLDLVDASHYIDLSTTPTETSSTDTPKIDIAVLRSAMYHASGDIRIDVLGILCESRRSTTPVATIEFQLLMQLLPLNLNSVVPDFRQRLYSHLAKFLARVHGNCYVLAREIARLHTPVGKNGLSQDEVDSMILEREAKVAETKAFLEWLLSHLFSSIYPGASFQRVSTCLRLLGVMIKTFGVDATPLPSGSKPGDVSRFPFQLPIASTRNIKTLLSCLQNPFDHCREQALEILMNFKAPFEGYDSKDSVDNLVLWGLECVKSTRADESDSGGLVLKTVFVKYAVELGWDIQLPYEKPDDPSSLAKETGNPAVDFVIRLQNLLRVQLEKAKLNQLDAAHHHPLHGTLIGLRYIFSSLDYGSPLVTNNVPLWRAVHADMMELVENVCGTVMSVLSNPSPEGNIPATFTEMEESIDAVISTSGGDEFEQSSGPNHQVILSYCWRAVKESSSLMELVLSKATLQSSTRNKVDGILEPNMMDRAGGLFRRLLTSIRHPGAFSSVFPAYISLCTRLLNLDDPPLAALPRIWLDEILDAILSDAISVTRRSAGLPLCILAIVNAELSDNRRTLLPMVMRRIMGIASKPVGADANQQVDLPQIHAMNVMRRLFMDAKLSTAVLPYVGQGLELSIRAFSSPSWAVRNCGVMLFSTLLHRVFGAKRVRDEHMAINGITSRELFARLEGLCGFLQGQLEVAVSQLLGAESSQDRVHPGLYPVLTLLSRLQPSLHADPDDAIDGGMSAFVTLVRRCAASAIWKTREMAARALIPLIASRDMMDLVVDILKNCMKPKILQNEIHGLLVQVQFLLRGHLLSEGVADRKVRQSFVTRFAGALGPVTERVLKAGCDMNRWMILSLYTEFILGQEWMGSSSVESDVSSTDASTEVVSEREEMRQLSDIHFKSIRDFIVDYSIVGLMEEAQTYRQQIGGHLVRRLMARTVISATALGINVALSYEQASGMVKTLLNDQDYELRLETLETLQQLLESNRETVLKHLDISAIHCTLIETLFKGEPNLECLRLQVVMLSSLGGHQPFPKQSSVNMVEFWKRLFGRIEDEATGGVAVVEAILPATGKVFVQIWNDTNIPESVRIDCLNQWATSINKFANEHQTLQLREAALESISFFTDQLLDPQQTQPSFEKTRAYLQLFEALIWQLQDDEAEIRESATQVISRGSRLPCAVSSEKALMMIYDDQIKRFGGKGATEPQMLLLLDALVSGLVANSDPVRVVAESLQPNKMLFDKESPNLHREPLISIQLTQRSLEQILAGSDVPSSVHDKVKTFQGHCIKQIAEIQQLIKERQHSKAGHEQDHSPWGLSGRKSIFEILYYLASASCLLATGAGATPDINLEIIHDSSAHPVIVEASRPAKLHSGRLFLIE